MYILSITKHKHVVDIYKVIRTGYVVFINQEIQAYVHENNTKVHSMCKQNTNVPVDTIVYDTFYTQEIKIQKRIDNNSILS
jgi:hypothetical protein